MNRPVVIAHRTCPPYAPENSLEGFDVAVEQGADGIEIDLRSSLDLKPFLMHDNTMKRTTGWPLPIELTPSFLVRRQRLIGGNEPPPTLADTIAALPIDRVLAVDVKTPWSIVALISQIKRRRQEERTLVWCSSALVARYALSRLDGAEIAYYKDFEDGPPNLAFIARSTPSRWTGEGSRRRLCQPHTLRASRSTPGTRNTRSLRRRSRRGWMASSQIILPGLENYLSDYPRHRRSGGRVVRPTTRRCPISD
jgi:hypothetical protein